MVGAGMGMIVDVQPKSVMTCIGSSMREMRELSPAKVRQMK